MAANDKQVGGTHYKIGELEPWDVIIAWDLGYLDGNALKYIARWKNKGGIEDIQKAIHYLEKLLELETTKSKALKDIARSPLYVEKFPFPFPPVEEKNKDVKDRANRKATKN